MKNVYKLSDLQCLCDIIHHEQESKVTISLDIAKHASRYTFKNFKSTL